MSLPTATEQSRPQSSAVATSLSSARDAYLRLYHRHAIDVDAPIPDRPVLIVSNHGFGGLVDLNVLAVARVLKKADLTRPATALVHQLAWTLGVGGFVERLGGRPASRENAQKALEAGTNVVVFPGGDLDAGKSWRDRNRIVFDGRCGFARLALEAQVPVVPVVTAGAGESLLVLSDGQGLAKALRLPELLRAKALPVSISLGWGLSVGAAGMLPYVSLPTKLHSAVLAPMQVAAGETSEAFAHRIHEAMQNRLDQLVAHRRPVLG